MIGGLDMNALFANGGGFQMPQMAGGGFAGPMPSQGLDIPGFAAQQGGGGGPSIGMLAQMLGGMGQKQDSGLMPLPQAAPHQSAMLQQLLASIGNGGSGNFLGRLGGR